MKNNTFLKTTISALILFFLVTLISCNSQRDKFKELLEKKDLALAYDFKSKYPETTFNIDSLIHELEYEKIKTSKNVNELNNFINRFPYSNYITDIQLDISRIEWDNLNKNWNSQDAQKYLNNYPESPFYEDVENWLFKNASKGIFRDKRDGRKYSWIKVGKQIWMTDRLAYGKRAPAIYEHFLYSVDELANASPNGWHISTSDDWIEAIKYLTNKNFEEVTTFTDGNTFFSNALTFKHGSQFRVIDCQFYSMKNSKPYREIDISKLSWKDGFLIEFGFRCKYDTKCLVLCVKDM